MKKKPFTAIVIVAAILALFTSCLTSRPPEPLEPEPLEEEIRYPDWVQAPPREDGYFFGVGGGPDLETAKMKSIISVAQQFKVQIFAEIQEQITGPEDSKKRVLKSLEKQITDQEVIGAKFYKQFQNSSGEHWVLSRAPLECVMDVTQAVLIKHESEFKDKNVEKAVNAAGENTKSSREYYKTNPIYGISHENSLGMNFRLIKAGSFTMGSPGDEAGRNNDEKQHQVTISHDYYLGQYEVTQGEYRNIMGKNPAYFSENGENRPVEIVTWHDAVEFCRKLNAREGYEGVHSGSGDAITVDLHARGYRLPTEAEWEYGARGGSESLGYVYSGGNTASEAGWYNDNSGNESHPVGIKQANELGLYDMSGNVWEWCWDWYGGYPARATDPAGPASGRSRVVRGGGWRINARYLRSAFRSSSFPGNGDYDLGFRVLFMPGTEGS